MPFRYRSHRQIASSADRGRSRDRNLPTRLSVRLVEADFTHFVRERRTSCPLLLPPLESVNAVRSARDRGIDDFLNRAIQQAGAFTVGIVLQHRHDEHKPH